MNWEKKFTTKNTTGFKQAPHDRAAAARSQTDQNPDAKDSSSAPAVLKKIHRSLDDIWSNIYLESHKKQNMLFLCGAVPGEGCTFISFHLALFLAHEHNMKVLYVETNTDSDGDHSLLPQLHEKPGLASYYIEHKPLSSLILRTEYKNLFVLPSGFKTAKDRIKNKNIIFKREEVENLVDFCRNNFDVTIFDGQPITFSPVMIGFAKVVGKVVMVCRYGYSRREVTALALEKLHKNNISVIGAVLNDRHYPIPPKVYNLLK